MYSLGFPAQAGAREQGSSPGLLLIKKNLRVRRMSSSLFRTGASVVVFGLAQRPELNERPGKILGYDNDSERFMVRLAGDGGEPVSVRVRAANGREREQPRRQHEVDQRALNDDALWARGLGADAAREWLCDCYRMRCDDDVVWGGGYFHGAYDEDAVRLRPGLLISYCAGIK
jgi:hypothetical protein